MANEIRESLNFTARKNGAEVAIATSNNITMTGDDLVSLTQVIGTTEETVGFGDITGAPGEVIIKNLDATNFVRLSATGQTGFAIKLLPGRFTVFQPTSATLYAIADTAAVRIQIIATEV